MSTRFPAPVACFLFLLTLPACGSSDPSPAPPPPPPPPPAAVPASLTGQSAALQDAEPGALVAVRPAVLVRDAAGRGVANVAVTFAVDSGGGTTSGSAVTGPDGVATVGEWRLGPSEGRQVLAATVATLPPVRFVAVAMVAPVTLPPQVVPAGGGTVTLVRPGSTVDGLAVTIPPGAITGGTTLTFGLRSAASAVLPPGYLVASPVVQLSAPGAVLEEPVLVTFPLREKPNTTRFVAVIEPGTERLIPLPVVEWTSTTVTVALPVLDRVAQNNVLPGVRDPDPRAIIIEALGGLIDQLAPDLGDFDTGFRPGVDDWDFRRQPIAGIPNLSPGPTVDPAAAMVESARWYFHNRKAADGPLWQRFQLARGIPESNRAGLRWMGVAGSRLPRALENSVTYNRLRVLWSAPGTGLSHLEVLRGIKQRMSGDFSIIGGPRGPRTPVPVMLFAGTSLEAPRFALAFRTEGNALDVAVPDEPGRAFRVQFSAGGITPFQVSTVGGGTFTVTGISPASLELSNGLRNDLRLPEEWPRVASGTIGDAERWRTARLRGWFLPDVGNHRIVELDRADVPVLDDFQHWWECVACADNGFRTGIPGSNVNPLLFRLVMPLPRTGSATLPAEVFTKAEVAASDLSPSQSQTGGFALYLAGPGSALDIPQGTSWFDWTTIEYRTVPVTLSPARHLATEDGPVTFTAAVTGTPPGATYRWDFEGATDPQTGQLVVKETVDTPTPQLTYRLERARMNVVAGVRTAKMRVRVLDSTGRPVGQDEVFVEMAGDQVAWRLQSFAATQQTGADADFNAVLASPSDWVVFVFLKPVPGMPASTPTPGVYLQRRPGAHDAPVAFAPSGATTIPLAHRVTNPAIRVTGAFNWTGDLTSGQVTGNGTPLNQTCTQFLGAITATKEGTTLSGEISRHITRLANCDGGLLDVLNRATFTARRLPPA